MLTTFYRCIIKAIIEIQNSPTTNIYNNITNGSNQSSIVYHDHLLWTTYTPNHRNSVSDHNYSDDGQRLRKSIRLRSSISSIPSSVLQIHIRHQNGHCSHVEHSASTFTRFSQPSCSSDQRWPEIQISQRSSGCHASSSGIECR